MLGREVLHICPRVLDDGLDAILEAGLGLVLLALTDDLAVTCLDREVAFSVLGFFDFKVVFGGAVLLNGFDSVEGGCLILVSLALKDDFSVTSFQSKVKFLGFLALEYFVHRI